MADQATTVFKRLQQAGSLDRFQSWWEAEEGDYVAKCCVSAEDVPGLIEIARKWTDEDWPWNELEEADIAGDVELLPVFAWRSLADLKAEQAAQPLVPRGAKQHASWREQQKRRQHKRPTHEEQEERWPK